MNVDEKRQTIVKFQHLLYIYSVYNFGYSLLCRGVLLVLLYLQTVKDGKNLCCYVSMLIRK